MPSSPNIKRGVAVAALTTFEALGLISCSAAKDPQSILAPYARAFEDSKSFEQSFSKVDPTTDREDLIRKIGDTTIAALVLGSATTKVGSSSEVSPSSVSEVMIVVKTPRSEETVTLLTGHNLTSANGETVSIQTHVYGIGKKHPKTELGVALNGTDYGFVTKATQTPELVPDKCAADKIESDAMQIARLALAENPSEPKAIRPAATQLPADCQQS